MKPSGTPPPIVGITDSSDEDLEDDISLLVDWRGKPRSRSASSKRTGNPRKARNTNITTPHDGTPTNNGFQCDPQTCRKIFCDDDSVLVVDNTPDVSVNRHRSNHQRMHTADETSFGEGSTPSIVLETPISAQLKNVKKTARLSKCSGGADLICLDSDNEPDSHVNGVCKEEKPFLEASNPCTPKELQSAVPSAEYTSFLGKRVNYEKQDKNLDSGEEHKMMLETEFVDNNPKKETFEYISKTSVLDFKEDITLYDAGKTTNAADITISAVFHPNDDEKGPLVESIGINSEAREEGHANQDAFDASIGTEDFCVVEVPRNIEDMDQIESCPRGMLSSNGVIDRTDAIQNSCETSSLYFLDSSIKIYDEGISSNISNAEIDNDNVLLISSIAGTVEQQVHGTRCRRQREEDRNQDKTEDLNPKEAGNKRQRKDRGVITREREEEKKRKQEEKERTKQEKEEDKQRQKEEKKRKIEEEKMQKASAKAEAAEIRKRQNEMKKWEKGKFALKSISLHIDTRVIERGLIGGHLLNRLAEKEFCFHIVSNQVRSSILWKMNSPDLDTQSSLNVHDVRYILVVLEAEEFCNLVSEGSLNGHVCNLQRLYPGYIICYLINKLMSYITKREQEQYKNPGNASCWRRPPVEQALANFVTHFVGVHSRLCLDEAEVADHIIGLTRSLAECHFRQKLTHLSINANGSHVPKDCPQRDMIKKSLWLKSLVAIPKLPPKCAIAIAKKYPTMRSLLNVYLDPARTVHEKEFLLQDLVAEGLLGDGGRRLGPFCSKRIYRILMARSGSLKTDDVEDGADHFED